MFSILARHGIRGVLARGHGLLFRLRPAVRTRWRGRDPNRHSLAHAIYVHYDPSGSIADFVLFQLRQLSDLGFRITLVSNSPRLDDLAIERAAPSCRQIIHRHNIGYDFGGYREGLLSIGNLDTVQTIILTNDSVYGPLFPLSEYLASCDPNELDVWGMTDSEEHSYHVQSYFLVVHKRALQSRAFRNFWAWYPYVPDKDWVVRLGEIGFSEQLRSAGLRIGALFRCSDAERRRQRMLNSLGALQPESATIAFINRLSDPNRKASTFNPTHYYWDELIEAERFPFIKRDLIRDNPANVLLVPGWREVLERCTPYDLSLIETPLRHEPSGGAAIEEVHRFPPEGSVLKPPV